MKKIKICDFHKISKSKKDFSISFEGWGGVVYGRRVVFEENLVSVGLRVKSDSVSGTLRDFLCFVSVVIVSGVTSRLHPL